MHAVMLMRKTVARYQRTIVEGSAIVYRMCYVKLKRRNRFPKNPQIRKATFN